MNVDPRAEFLYKEFEKKLPPAVPSGPEPKSGQRARGGPGSPAGRILSTLEAPRRQIDRTIGDEFALLAAQANKIQKAVHYPIDPYDPSWSNRGADVWLLQNILGRIATGRVNAYMCAAGQGHCHEPGFFEQIGNAISKIPVVGDIAHIVGEVYSAPFNLAASIVKGERLDHALLDSLKGQIKIVKDVAPYAQTVVSLVPGVGTGVAAAIGAGAALAEGKSLDGIAKAAIKGALPGGAVAAAAFDVAMKAASGENVGKAALESARNLVPAGPAQKAFDIGVAVATGEKLQNAVVRGLTSLAPAQLQDIAAVGQKAISTTPGLSDALKSVAPGAATQGFQLAAGLLSHSGMSEKALAAVRAKLPSAVRQGFDAALKSQEKHLAWLSNVTSGAAPAPAPEPTLPPRSTPKPTEPPKHAAATPKPPEPHAAPSATPKPPEPAKASAKTASTPKPPEPKPSSTPKPSEPTPQAPGGPRAYGPYPSGMVSGLGATLPYGPYGALSAPPHPLHPHGGGHRSPVRPFVRGGARWPGGWWPWIPYNPDGVTAVETCRVWGNPIDMPHAMQQAALTALGASGGQPATVRGPDGVLYLFSYESGALTARPCAAAAIS